MARKKKAPKSVESFKHEEASRRHAEIILDEHERWLLRDLGSTNGTFYNGKEIDALVVLRPADEIQIGEGIFRIKGRE